VSNKYYQVVGCIHIHSVYSDGSGTIGEISRQAEEVGLDFIMISDHNNLRALHRGEEGWYGNVLTLIGYEINDIDDANHYLAFNLEEEVGRNLPASEYVRRVKMNGGFGIIAHPDESRYRLPEHPPYPWTAWESVDYQGIEIWNQMSEWMEGLTSWNKLWRFINPRRSIIAPTTTTLKKWDEVNRKRPVFGIGGVDAHAHKHKMLFGLLKVTVFKYKIQFKSMRTHLLLSEPLDPHMDLNHAKNLIYDALLSCRVFISNFFNGDAREFRFYAQNANGLAEIGGTLPYASNTEMIVNVSREADVMVFRDGEPVKILEKYPKKIKVNRPGNYRLEIFRKKRAWIYTNHLRIVDEEKELDQIS
jgi:hypothetical protein